MALAAALAAALLGAPAAGAACGGVEKAHPKRKVAKRPPLVIGDSVMLFALPNLARKGFNVDARGCRQFEEGIHLLIRKRRGGRLPYLVVMALGADAAISGRQINRVQKIIGPKRKLGLVVPLETGGRESNDARVVRNAGRQRPAPGQGARLAPLQQRPRATGSSPTTCTSPSPAPPATRG